MYVNSKFTDNREVTCQDYNEYVFRPPSGKTPYGNTVWRGLASNKYLTHGNLTNTDGKNNSVGFHTVSGATHTDMASNRLVPAVWHTAINPYVILSGYTMGGGTLTVYNGNLDDSIHFEYISHWQFKFRDGAQYRCDVYSGYLFGSEDEEIDLSIFDEQNGRSYANWYSGNTSVTLSQVSAHGDLSSVTYTGYDISMASDKKDMVEKYEVLDDSSTYIWVKRGDRGKWHAIGEGTPLVFGSAGITTTDILNFNASGQSKYDFHIFVSFEPIIEVTMANNSTFPFLWNCYIRYSSAPHPNHSTIQFRLENPDNSGVTYATEAIPTSATTSSTINVTVTKQIPTNYLNREFKFNWLGAITGYAASTAVTNTTLTTGGTTTTLYLTKN